MTVIEKVELTTITAFMVFFILLRHRLPTPSSHATLILSLSSLLLLQGLIRDLICLVQLNKSVTHAQTRMVFGLCVESFVGIVGVMTGAFWMFAFAYTALQISTIPIFNITSMRLGIVQIVEMEVRLVLVVIRVVGTQTATLLGEKELILIYPDGKALQIAST